MHLKKYLAIPLLLASSLAVAEPAQAVDPVPKTNPVVDPGKKEVDKAAIPATPAAPEYPMFKFGGFGTLGGSHSTLDQGDYVPDSGMPEGAGLSSDWALGNHSRISVHATADFSPQLSGIFQLDSEYRSNGSYRPEIEWFYVKYAFTPDLYVRAGRIALPTFIDSETHDVGYSYVWVTPPVDLYHQLSIPSSDGIDFSYRSEFGEIGNTFKAIYGSNTKERPGSRTVSEDMWGVFDTVEYESAIFRASYQQRHSRTTSLDTGVEGASTTNSDLTLGASYDTGDWFVISEWMQRRSNVKIGAMYVSGGYRIDKFTPYAGYSQNSPGSFYASSTPPTASAIERAKRSQSTISLGMRWDFMRNADCKVQLDRVTLSDDSNGYLVNVPTGVTLHGRKFYVMSAVVDFVF